MNKEDIKLLKKAANATGLEVIGYGSGLYSKRDR